MASGLFVMEGVLQGGIGAIAALVILAVAFVALRARYLAPLASAINLSSIQFLPLEPGSPWVLGFGVCMTELREELQILDTRFTAALHRDRRVTQLN